MTFPELCLSTSRLQLRTPERSDATALQEIVSDPRVALKTASIPHPYPENGAIGFIEHVRSVAGPDRRNLAIRLASGGDLIGMVGFGGTGSEAELAYMISPNYWGNGYATEAARRLIAYIFEQSRFNAVIARAMRANPASEGVLRKLGFHLEAQDDVELPVRSAVFKTSFWRLDHRDGYS
jgi:RimJ/RimL family protein N-acetyltransferase